MCVFCVTYHLRTQCFSVRIAVLGMGETGPAGNWLMLYCVTFTGQVRRALLFYSFTPPSNKIKERSGERRTAAIVGSYTKLTLLKRGNQVGQKDSL